MQKLGWFGGLGVIGNLAIRQSTYDFLFDFNRNYASILYRYRVTARFSSKVTNFNPPHLHLSPPQGVIPFEFRHDLWHQKTRVMGLSCGVVCVILRLAVLIQYRSVTDRHTDRHTTTANTALSIASRGKNCKNHKKVILLSITLIFRRRDGGQYHLLSFLQFFIHTQQIHCSFYHLFL